MKIAVIGGAGAQGCVAVRDLAKNPEVKEILCADLQGEKAKKYAASFKDPRVKGAFVDAYNIDETVNLIKDYDVVINAAQYWTNINVMKACLKTMRPYLDLGGLYWGGKQQQEELGDSFIHAGLMAVIGIGMSVGITNICARYAYDLLDEVDSVHFECGNVDLTDTKGIDAWWAPFAIRTFMEEYVKPPVHFINGEYKTLPLFSGEEEVYFPEPVGRCPIFNCVHAELTTIPLAFKDKGVKNVSYKIGFSPWIIEERAKFLASLGFGSKEPVKVQGVEVSPLEVLAVVVEKQMKEKFGGEGPNVRTMGCLRTRVIGKEKGRKTEYVLDLMCLPTKERGDPQTYATGVAPSIVAQMIAKGMIMKPGVIGPEEVIDPYYFFAECEKRNLTITITKREYIK